MLLLVIISGLCLKAQTHHFIYEVGTKKDSTKNDISKSYMILDINKEKSFYYSMDYYVLDSIYKKTGNMIFGGRVSDYIIKDLESKNYTTYIFSGFDSYKLKDNPIQKWIIKDETKIISGMKAQKAESSWAGRNWTAWFSTEIPFPEGPYKFNGLPGLILEVRDSQEYFSFKMIGSKVIDPTLLIEFFVTVDRDTSTVEIPYSKYRQILIAYYNSPMKAARNGKIDYVASPIMVEEGVVISNAKELREYEIAERERIKQYNNPIERDKIVDYTSIK